MGKFDMRRLFYRGKYQKEKDNITAMLLPSFLGIILCAVCLMGTTFAWFSASQEAQTHTIEAANYSAFVSVDGEAATETIALNVGKHTVQITADGTATTGYFILEYGDWVLHTAQVGKGATISIAFEVNEAVTLKITPQWGFSAKAEEERIKDGDTLVFGEPAPILCTCETKCTDLNEACQVCKADITNCTGKELVEPETSTNDEKQATEPSTEATEQSTAPDVSEEDMGADPEENGSLDDQEDAEAPTTETTEEETSSQE